MKTRFLLIGIVMLILIMPWSIGMAQDSEENEYSIWSLDINDFWRHNLTFNDFLPWLRLDHFMYYLPTASQVRKATECLDGIGKPLPVEMKYGITANPPSVYSQKDVEHPIVLIPAYTTNMDIRTFLPEEEIVDLISLTVPDGEGGWKDASEADREFYSYRMEGEWFKLRFPENKTKDFRCLAMTIGVMDRMGDSNGKSVMVPTDTTRTWIFIQLPWTNDFAILNQIPYTDFTPYKYEKRRAPADCEKPTGDKTTIGQKTLLRDNYIKYGRSFMLLPDFDEENPDPEKLFVGLLPMAQGGGSDLVTQMRIEDGNDNFCLYSSHDATHPIILLSAKETRIEVRVPPAYHIETDLAALLVPGKKDGWRDATKKERMFYSYSREGDWFKLTFPQKQDRQVSVCRIGNRGCKAV